MSLTPLEKLYLPVCQKAAGEASLDPVLLLAMCGRESGYGVFLIPKGPSGLGDGGHGHGLWQIDDRTWGAWLASNNWQDPLTNCRKACDILRTDLEELDGNLPAAVAAYNAGPGRARMVLDSLNSQQSGATLWHLLDKVTTDLNYVTDVFHRRAAILSRQDADG